MRYRYIPSLLCLLLCLLCLLTGCNGGDTPPASDTPEESAPPSVTAPADGEITLTVAEGDEIAFIINRNGSNAFDATDTSVTLAYQ